VGEHLRFFFVRESPNCAAFDGVLSCPHGSQATNPAGPLLFLPTLDHGGISVLRAQWASDELLNLAETWGI